MERLRISKVLEMAPSSNKITICGWVRTFRNDRFLAVNDGSTIHSIQLVVQREDLKESGVNEDNLKKVSLVFLGTHQNSTSDGAEVVLPGLTVFEKSGSFINRSFFLQSFFFII